MEQNETYHRHSVTGDYKEEIDVKEGVLSV